MPEHFAKNGFFAGSKIEELEQNIRVGAVSYLNTKPLLYGFKHGHTIEQMVLTEDYPARIAEMLLADEIDVGLVPVAIIPRMKEYHIVSDYCIGANGPVASVGLFSEVPLDQIKTVILDYQSRTSVALARVLIQHWWKLDVRFEEAQPDFRDRIAGDTAAVVIGDRAFEQRTRSGYMFDLAEHWKAFTGLPFVFAAWIANKPLPPTFTNAFNQINSIGLQHIDRVVAEHPYRLYDLLTYYTHNISYKLTEEKQQGLQRFLSLIQPFYK